jgi:hypothetical protein
MQCINCGSYSWNSRLCRNCREIKQNATAILCQNKYKLQVLLQQKDFVSPKNFERFLKYTDNIRRYWRVLMEYKRIDVELILKAWTWLSCMLSVIFLLEISLTM